MPLIPTLPTPTSPALDTHLRESLNTLASRGYLTMDVTHAGAQVTAAQRLAGRWEVGGWAGLTWDGQKSAGMRLKGQW